MLLPAVLTGCGCHGPQCVAPYLSAAVQQSSVAGLVKAFLHKCNADAGSSDEEEDDGVDLCNCEFSLAYGAGCVWKAQSRTFAF